jgi:hypothetical protein
LGVPPRALWERIPGIPQHEVDRWEALAAEGDSIGALTAMLDRQSGGVPAPAPPVPVG